ncbi:MAG TPA: zinc ABC transporter substrate-binding protein [Chlamydiales bacterium]|nr:zinc ABC transporter substrate-binding protein [Chlamydiales bacterium]
MSLLLFFSCGKRDFSSSKPTLLVSVAPYQKIVEKIAGDSFQVQTVVPPGSNPHAYEPTLRQIGAIGKGLIWFRIGESFEKKVFPVLQEKNPLLTDCDLREGLSLIRESACHCHHEVQEDRHFWLSPKILIPQVHTIANVLASRFPEKQATFQKNSEELIRELDSLDIEIKTILEHAPSKSFLVSHAAFAYFCKEYDLHQFSIEYGGKEPTAKHLTQLMHEMQESKAKVAIAMPQHSNKGVELIANKTGMHLHEIDPYASDYAETMRALAQLMVQND